MKGREVVRIVAIIPARAGSKGIPNKNIRIINGKPLIAYCIENALNSKYITETIITTDSPEIELIANYYGVNCVHRCPKLCEDAVTLDSVIYDACKDVQADYVITLQPTSPTLEYETLDKAIQFAIENNTDTLISVVNKPHLAWVEKDGKIVPDYKERLNRQYLPERYLETGAFVISKSEIVTEKTRIGQNVGVYEISERESIDVDSFQDLMCVEQVLQEHRTAIVVNGNNQIGMGHISRMLELADLFYHKPDIYYDCNITKKDSFGNTTYKLLPYFNQDDLINQLAKENYQVIINDILDTDEAYMQQIKSIESKPNIVNFEDLGKGRRKADIVINALYNETVDRSNTYCGEKFYIVPKMFLLYKPIEINVKVKNVFICFGGADPQNYTEKSLDIISEKMYESFNFTVVLGKAKKNYDDIIRKYSKENIQLLYDVKNMPELMSKCDFAITSRGRTCYELATLGIPTIAMAQNAREEKHDFVCIDNGFKYIGSNVVDEQIKEALDNMLNATEEERKEMQERMLKHNLKNGRERVKNLIDSL